MAYRILFAALIAMSASVTSAAPVLDAGDAVEARMAKLEATVNELEFADKVTKLRPTNLALLPGRGSTKLEPEQGLVAQMRGLIKTQKKHGEDIQMLKATQQSTAGLLDELMIHGIDG